MDVKLDLLNAMLAAIGSSGISSTTGRHPGLIRSEPILDRHNRSLQARGHWFNTDWGLTILPETDGRFSLPQGTIKADTTIKSKPYVRRGQYLYDPRGHTFEIAEDSIDVDVVIQLEYEDLPEAALDLIRAKAVLELVTNSDADQITLIQKKSDVAEAKMAFEVQRLSQADYTLRDNPQYSRILGGLRSRYNRSNPSRVGG